MPNLATTLTTMVGQCSFLILTHNLDQRPLGTPSCFPLVTTSLWCSDFINTLRVQLPPFPEIPRATTLALMVPLCTCASAICTDAVICRSPINWHPTALAPHPTFGIPPLQPWPHHWFLGSIHQPPIVLVPHTDTLVTVHNPGPPTW